MATWAEIRDNAFQIVLLTQRDDKLWSFPTRSDEHTHAPPGTIEEEIRSSTFGHSSITVSYNAVLAAHIASAGHAYGLAAAVDKSLEDYRDSNTGAYGSPTTRLHNERSINALPRHTAMAAVMLLTFKANRRLEELSSYLAPTIQWLFEHERDEGGWPYDRNKKSAEPGFMTTASVLAALGAYVKLNPEATSVREKALRAAQRALEKLAETMKGPIWAGDGSHVDNAFVDTAFALMMLLEEGALDLLTDQRERVQVMLTSFFAAASTEGLPRRPEETAAFPAATISGLLVMEAAHRVGFQVPPTLAPAMDTFVLSSWDDGTLIETLEAWDWQNLTMLATHRAGPIPNARRIELKGVCDDLTEKRRAGTATQKDLNSLSDKMRGVADYVLSCGKSLPVQESVISAKIKEIRWDFFKNALWAAAAALVTLLASWIVGWIG